MIIEYGSGDTKFDTADDFIGGKLVALKPISKYDAPNGKIIKTIPVNGLVGYIHSWVTNNGTWWLLQDGSYVKQETGNFDKEIVRQSVLDNEKQRQTEIDKAVKVRQDANDSTLYNIGKGLPEFFSKFKWIILVIFIVILIAVFYRISGK